jgi:hypothetical protein
MTFKIILFAFLLAPDGRMELGTAENGYPPQEYYSFEECEADIEARHNMAQRMLVALECREITERNA